MEIFLRACSSFLKPVSNIHRGYHSHEHHFVFQHNLILIKFLWKVSEIKMKTLSETWSAFKVKRKQWWKWNYQRSRGCWLLSSWLVSELEQVSKDWSFKQKKIVSIVTKRIECLIKFKVLLVKLLQILFVQCFGPWSKLNLTLL